ncbi:acyltransferase domain-containing protein [Nocardia sp. NPDC006630]|uniref:acyltransferase domain-containing protein n=1 Tax=Nocardia sp. NPDC006630 TaxID=3157181 RepID=UPI0033BEDDE4
MRESTAASTDRTPLLRVSIVGVAYRATRTAFDHEWFGITEREAAAMDPRRRMNLELAVEALDDSGLGCLARGSRAAVVFGGATGFAAGPTNSAHQLSRALDLHGPSLTVDSDRASPLVAVDTAVRLLADNAVPFVIAGGADLTLLPDLSGLTVPPDSGVCTVLVLQRTLDAARTGTRSYAEIAGTGLGFPGSGAIDAHIALRNHPTPHSPTSRGEEPPILIPLSAPDPAALHSLAQDLAQIVTTYPTLREFATAVARLVPDEVRAALLAHDTTDAAVQLRALAQHIAAAISPSTVYSANYRATTPAPSDPDTAEAGHLRLDNTPGPGEARWADSTANSLAADREPSPQNGSGTTTGAVRRPGAAVATTRGSTGTDGHPESSVTAAQGNSCGAGAGVVRRFVGSVVSAVARPAGTGAVVGVSEQRREGGVLLLFSGGGGHARMGRGLAGRYPVFAGALTDAADAVAEAGGPRVWTPRTGFGHGEVGEDFAQPALFVLQVALAELLESWGVRAEGVAGHGVGEIAAAAVSGAVSLGDAARIVVARGRLLSKIGDHGAAAVLEATPAEALRLLEPMRATVGVAAIDGPRSVIVSGEPRYIDALVRRAHRRAIFAQRINADSAAAGTIAVPHIPQVRAVAPQLITELAGITPRRPECAVYSTTRRGTVIGGPGLRVGGNRVAAEPHWDDARDSQTHAGMDAAYWGENAAGPVELGAALEQAAADGFSTVVEIGPHPVLAAIVREQAAFRESTYSVASRADEAASFLRTIARLHLDGRAVDWTALGPQTAPPPQRRWRRTLSVDGAAVQPPEVPIRAEGTYVVAGGLGNSGAVAVRWLLDAGARDVVVLTRMPRALPPPLDGMDDWIVVMRCDAADRTDLATALHDIRECGSPIRGVVHAGREPDRTAAVNLLELTASDPTDFTIGFSTSGWQPLSRVSGATGR